MIAGDNWALHQLLKGIFNYLYANYQIQSINQLMAFITYTSGELAAGKHADTGLFEKKPIGFREDEGLLNPYSNIFYWTYKWTDKGTQAEEHSYKGFEIITFMLTGEIEYYDNNYRGWKKLSAGDMQVLRSGNGVIHSERLLPGSSLIQIWADPDLEKSTNMPVTYFNYTSDQLPVLIEKGRSTKIFSGPESPVRLQTEHLVITEASFSEGYHFYKCSKKLFVSGFVLEGDLVIRRNTLAPKDFFVAKEEESLEIKAITDCRLFITESPIELSYPTYTEKYRI
jgi:quercetin 2,3-dioxygenase